MTRRVLFVILLTLTFVLGANAQSTALLNDLESSFSNVTITRVDVRDAIRRVKTGQTVKLSASSWSVDLNLTPRDLRSPRYFAEETTAVGVRRLERGAVNTYKGKISGDPSSQVRMTIDEKTFEGYFRSGEEIRYIEPANRYSALAANDEFVVYMPNDILRNTTFYCPQDIGGQIEDGKKIVGSLNVENRAGLKTVEVATEADHDFVLTTNGNSVAANLKVLSILNYVEGLYETELNLGLTVVFQHAFATADGYNGANASALMASFQLDWTTRYPYNTFRRDTAHLFTYKPNVRAQGYAFLNSICSIPADSFGLSGRIDPSWGWEIANSMVTAHEIGHNLGATHSDGFGNCGNSVMNTQLSPSTQFSFCAASQDQIDSYVAANGSCMTTPSSGRFDFDGDGKTDISIFRPDAGEWWINRSTNGETFAAQFGSGTDRIASGDFTGDGATDIAIFRPSNGNWYILRSEDSSFFSFPFGSTGDVPVPADFDGDGKTDPAIFRPSTSTWYVSRSGDGGTTIAGFGVIGDVPVTADYDGDFKSDIAIFRPSVGEWWIQKSASGTVAFQFGAATDKPVPGDYTGDGKSDVVFFRPSNGFWYVLRSEDNSFFSFPFGANGDIPAPGDYDGDGKFDATVFRPSANTWYVNRTTSGTAIIGFGVSGDRPVPSAFVP